MNNTSTSAGVFNYNIKNNNPNVLTADWKKEGSTERTFYFPHTFDVIDFTLYIEVPEDATYDNYNISWNTGVSSPVFLIQDGDEKTTVVAKGEKWLFGIS